MAEAEPLAATVPDKEEEEEEEEARFSAEAADGSVEGSSEV